MKKLLTLFLSAAMLLSMAACSNSTTPTTPIDSTADSTANSAESATVSEGKIIMSTEAGFAPYEYLEGENIVGIDVDIANEIASQLGKEIEIMDVDFTNALLAPQQGKSDFAAAGISINEERKQTMDFSIEYASSKQVIVAKKGGTSITDEATLVQKNIGVQTGTTAELVYGDTEAFPNTQIQSYKKYMVAAGDLKNGKIDCIVMDELPGKMVVEGNPDLEILPVELFTDKYAFAVKKGNQALLDQINPIIQKMLDEGKIDEFTTKHMSEAL